MTCGGSDSAAFARMNDAGRLSSRLTIPVCLKKHEAFLLGECLKSHRLFSIAELLPRCPFNDGARRRRLALARRERDPLPLLDGNSRGSRRSRRPPRRPVQS
jgi:hypothetical protein